MADNNTKGKSLPSFGRGYKGPKTNTNQPNKKAPHVSQNQEKQSDDASSSKHLDGKKVQQQPKQKKKTLTKKEIEKEQRELYQARKQELQKQIEEHEQYKRKNPSVLEKRHSYVVTPLAELKQVPDLSPHWVENIDFLPVLPQTAFLDFTQQEEVWKNINLDLCKLLAKDYKHFWSQVVYDESFHVFYESFLRYFERSYDRPPKQKSQEAERGFITRQSQELAFKHMFYVILRMYQYQESKIDFMEKSFHADLLYEKHFVSVAKLMDISTLYGSRNKDALTTVISNLFDSQPRLLKDLNGIMESVVHTLQETVHRIDKLSTQNLDKANEKDFGDSFKYLLDTITSVSAFLVVYPDASYFMGQRQPNILQQELLHLYQSVLPRLQKLTGSDYATQILDRGLISLGCSLLDHYYFRGVLNRLESKQNRERAAELLFSTLQQLIDQHQQQVASNGKSYFLDLSKPYPIQGKLFELKSIDNLKFDRGFLEHILSLLEKICGVYTPSAAAEADDPNGALIAQIRAFLPDLGEGFIEECLEAFGRNPEIVINRIMEDNLPPHLADLDKQLPRKEPQVSLLSSRKSIYDNDEFDIVANDTIDQKKIILKKNIRDESQEFLKLLDDKSELEGIRSKYSDYLYEDEYDDALDNYEGNFKISQEQTKEEAETMINNNEKEEDETGEDLKEEEEEETSNQKGLPSSRGSTPFRGRGRGRGQKAKHHNRKDLSMKKRTFV